MKKLFTLFMGMLLCARLLAGDPVWKAKFTSTVNWQKVTPLGLLVVSANDGFYGIDNATGQVKWKIDFLTDLKEENYDPIENSPYVAIVKRGMFPEHVIIDVATGRVICKTKDMEFQRVQKRFEIPRLGGILFYGFNKSNKGQMILVNAETGSVLWKQEKLFESNSEIITAAPYAVSDEAFVISTTKEIYKLNGKTGEVMWKQEMKTQPPALQEAEGFGAFGGKGNALANGNATSTSAQFLKYKNPNLIYFASHTVMTAFDIETGKEVWKRAELESPVAQIIFDDRGILLCTDDSRAPKTDAEGHVKKAHGLIGKLANGGGSGKAFINLYDPETGASKWSGGALDLAGSVVFYSYAGNKLCVATEKSKGQNAVNVIDLDAGKPAIPKQLKVDGTIVDVRMLPQGLLYRTTEETNILDLNTGKDVWPKSIKYKDGGLGVDKDGLTYFNADGAIYVMDNATGTYKTFANMYKFDGKEAPGSFELRSNGLLLTSSQNLTLVDFNGSQIYKVYKPAPGISTFGKIMNGALAATAMATSASQSYTSGYARGVGATSVADDYQKSANAWSGIAAASLKEISKRFKASKSTEDYQSILTKTSDGEEKGVGIVRINKDNGKEEAAIVLNNKKPVYELDPVGNMVYYVSGGSEISAYKF
ncbi:outer membrane protein assembly factor BamB family protein [Mucilaginibacter flavidus]|uniref:outer membrane protein assembly factor BamB family protein n=1 Tax=Mucilaginibacter flavidus TaxID=2949309 RepID=UPI002092486F|nr:PQQ-binding-like beta-propeller repeat protein [Mucilaginibacter flavidus]MCO5947473.1 PQQ-like beta-propeller repeat protein [Mucilaginibacter flavidus]